MDKLGYTFYPKDWWTSETFFKLPPELRYLYLEIISMLYMNDGYWKANRIELYRRFGVDPGDKGWELLESLFVVQGESWTHESVNKRLKKAIASRENGQKGGRPPKTQKTQKNNLKEPALESEIEIEIEEEKEEEKVIYNLESNPSGLHIFVKEGICHLQIHQQSFDKYLNGCFGSAYEQQKMALKNEPPINDFFKQRNGDIFNDNKHVWSSFKKLWINGRSGDGPIMFGVSNLKPWN